MCATLLICLALLALLLPVGLPIYSTSGLEKYGTFVQLIDVMPSHSFGQQL